MKFGIAFSNTGRLSHPDNATAMARTAEEVGFDSIWAADHVMIPAGHHSAYPYSSDGRMPWSDDVLLPDPLVWLSFIAGVTARIRLATGVLVLSQRNPVLVAKQAASVDRVSAGRLILGVGVGWLREECEALGVPFSERGERLEENVAVMRALWKGGETDFDGRFTHLERAIVSPTPVQDQGIPIVIGGHSRAAAIRAGRIGDGFFPAVMTLEQIEPLIAIMKTAAGEAGRDGEAIEVTAGGVLNLDGVKRFEEAGVSRILVPVFTPHEKAIRAQLEMFADLVMSKMGGN